MDLSSLTPIAAHTHFGAHGLNQEHVQISLGALGSCTQVNFGIASVAVVVGSAPDPCTIVAGAWSTRSAMQAQPALKNILS